MTSESQAQLENGTKPDFGSVYNPVYALASTKYLIRSLNSAIDESPRLSRCGVTTIFKLIDMEARLVRNARKGFLLTMALYAIYAYVMFKVLPEDFTTFTVVNLIGSTVLSVAAVLIARKFRRPYFEMLATSRITGTIIVIERNQSHWENSQFRWEIARRLERVAQAIEQIPLALSKVAPSVRQEALRLSRRKAQAIREIELSIIIPEATTQTETMEALTDSLQSLANGEWHKLPEADYKRDRPTLLLAAEVAGAILCFSGAITLVVFTSKLGPVATLISPLLIGGALAFLNMAGVPLNTFERYAKAGREVTTSKNEND